jgi:hypothetical protein
MEENKCPCPECEKRKKDEAETHELNFALLVALMPVLTLTFFNNIGLI